MKLRDIHIKGLVHNCAVICKACVLAFNLCENIHAKRGRNFSFNIMYVNWFTYLWMVHQDHVDGTS